MTGTSPAACGPWSRQEEPPGAEHDAIAAVREQLIEAHLPGTPPQRHDELLERVTLPEAVLVRLGSQTHRTDAVEELNTASCREYLRAVISDAGASLRLGRTDITGGLARIWCEPADASDDDAHAARVQSVHLAKVRQRWKITAIVTRSPHAT